MAITAEDLRFFQSERMSDTTDGGGQRAGTEILSGTANQIFDDLSDVDRVAGDVSIRKVFAQVASADAAKYLDAGVVVLTPPADPAVSVLAFSTGSHYDERGALRERLESGLSPGARWSGWLWGTHFTNQRALNLWQRPAASLPGVGQRLVLVASANGVAQSSQVVWITRVVDDVVEVQTPQGAVTVRSVVCELAEPLRQDFTGSEPGLYDATGATEIFATRYSADAVSLVGALPLASAAALGDYSVRLPSLYAALIPTATTETALADTTPGGGLAGLVPAAAGTWSFSTSTDCVKPGASLYLGGPVYPGTLSIVVAGSTITDLGGTLRLATTPIGTVDYSNGVCAFNDAAPAFGAAAKNILYRPGAAPVRIADTAAQLVTFENRGFVWVITLVPSPAAGTLRVSYRTNDEWYTLFDTGAGALAGVDASYGSGQLNRATGTVTLTCGGLPDVDSEIIYAWGTPISYTARGGTALDAPKVSGTTAHPGVAPGTVDISWSVGATTYTLSDDGAGGVSGTGGTGAIHYATGQWWVRPSLVPPHGTEFTISYDYGDPVTETFSAPARQPDTSLLLTLAAVPRPGSVAVTWPISVVDYRDTNHQMPPIPEQVSATDDGAGALPITGGTAGVVNYANATLAWVPEVTLTVPRQSWLVGEQLGVEASGPVYRVVFNGFWYQDTGGTFPGAGTVTVRYRPSGGDTGALETLTLTALDLDLAKGFGETLTAGSLRFTLGGTHYIHRNGALYTDLSPATGVGALAGTLDTSSGRARLTQWPAGGANAVTLDALVTEFGGQPVDQVIFRTATSPIKPGTLQLRWTDLLGSTFTKTPGPTGIITDNDCEIRVDPIRGLVRCRFGRWRLVSGLTPAELAADWYSADAIVTTGTVQSIWQSHLIDAASLVYNAVATTTIPPDSTLLGLDAARLPVDGRVLIYRPGMLALVHHTATLSVPTLSAGQVIDCGRLRLYRVVIDDSLQARLPADRYTLDRAAGLLTLADPLPQSGFTPPWTIRHTIADLGRLRDTDINGTLTFVRALSYDFPAATSLVSGMLYCGTLQARVSNLFAQTTWTGTWSDARLGDEPLCQYNATLYPIGVTNAAAVPDRVLVQITGATAFRVIGESLGIIAVGDTTQDCSPVNPLTGQPYFTIDARGWGLGWSVGNCLRFNVAAASYPIDLVRAVQPSQPSGLGDEVELLLVGNVDGA